MSTLRLWKFHRHSVLSVNLPSLQTVAHEKQTRIPPPGKEASPVMLTRLFQSISLWESRLFAWWDTSEKLYHDRLAYKHELNNLAINDFDGNHLLIGEGEYGQVYGVLPTKKRQHIGNMMKLGTTRCGKSTAEVCQIVDWEGQRDHLRHQTRNLSPSCRLPCNPRPRPQH